MRKYWINHNFYNMKNDKRLTILSNFKTYQQTTQSTCGPSCVLMIMNFFNDYSMSEIEISNECKCKISSGTQLSNIRKFFLDHKYEIETSIEQKKNDKGLIFEKFENFKDFVISNLKLGYPILVENVDYGGHYKVIIGYDTVSDNEEEDVLIFADPYDHNDGLIDGYNYFPADRFFYMWFDDKYLSIEQRKQPYILIKGKKSE